MRGVIVLFSFSLFAIGCRDDGGRFVPDSGGDASRDGTVSPPDGNVPDAPLGRDARVVPDAIIPFEDAAADANFDATADAQQDASLPDAMLDASLDASVDGAVDAMVDASTTFACIDDGCAGMVVISEIRTRGPGGANDEFVEIYNKSTMDINIGGMELRYISTGGTGSQRALIADDTIMGPGEFLLMANKAFSGPAVDVADQWATGLADGGGSVSLRVGGMHYIDRFGWGTVSATHAEGAVYKPTTDPCTTSCERKAFSTSTVMNMEAGGAHVDSGNGEDSGSNSADFLMRTAADPQNSASPAEAP